MKEQPLDIASLMQIEDLKNANKVLDSMVNDLRVEVQQLRERIAAMLDAPKGDAEFAPETGVPWQGHDGWEGRTP